MFGGAAVETFADARSYFRFAYQFPSTLILQPFLICSLRYLFVRITILNSVFLEGKTASSGGFSVQLVALL